MCSNAVQPQSQLTNLFKRNKDPGQNPVACYEEVIESLQIRFCNKTPDRRNDRNRPEID
jgi:hypothetical protein